MRLNSPQMNIISRACMKASRSLIRDFGEIENLQVSTKGPGDFVSSADKRLLSQVAEIVSGKLDTLEGVKDVEVKYPMTGVEWIYDIDRTQTSKYDVPVQSIGAIINLATTGTKIGTIRPFDTDEELNIRLFLPENDQSLDAIQNLNVNTKKGPIPVSTFINKRPSNKIFSMGRKDAARILIVDANTEKNFK